MEETGGEGGGEGEGVTKKEKLLNKTFHKELEQSETMEAMQKS